MGQLIAQGVGAKKWTLEECIEHAQKNNLDVKDASLNLDNSGYALDQSKWNQLPSVNAGASYGFNWGRSIDPTTNSFRTERINSIGISANANMTLWAGMQIRNSIRQNSLNALASESDLQTSRNNVSLFVANSFLNVVLNKEILQNSEYQKNIIAEQLDRTNKLVDAGSLPVSNKLDLESQLATAELNIITAENALDLSMLNLKQLLQIPASEPFDVEIPEVADPGNAAIENQPEDIYMTASEFLPDLKAVQYREESALVGQKVASGGYQPTVSVSAGLRSNYSSAASQFTPSTLDVPNLSIGSFNDATGNPVDLYTAQGFITTNPTSQVNTFTEENYAIGDQLNDNISQFLSFNLNIPIFNNMQTRINVQQSKIAYERSKINKNRVENQVRNDIEQAYNNVVATSKTYEARQKQVQALKEAFRVTEQRYNLGTVNSTDYQVATNNLNSAETDLVRAKYDYIFSLKVLDFYQGKPIY